jgi:hypothetical protein
MYSAERGAFLFTLGALRAQKGVTQKDNRNNVYAPQNEVSSVLLRPMSAGFTGPLH